LSGRFKIQKLVAESFGIIVPSMGIMRSISNEIRSQIPMRSISNEIISQMKGKVKIPLVGFDVFVSFEAIRNYKPCFSHGQTLV
jgi:hypothetical protein